MPKCEKPKVKSTIPNYFRVLLDKDGEKNKGAKRTRTDTKKIPPEKFYEIQVQEQAQATNQIKIEEQDPKNDEISFDEVTDSFCEGLCDEPVEGENNNEFECVDIKCLNKVNKSFIFLFRR